MQNASKIIRNTPCFIVLSQTSFYDYFYILHTKPSQYEILITSFVCKQTVKRFISKNAEKKRVYHGIDCWGQNFFRTDYRYKCNLRTSCARKNVFTSLQCLRADGVARYGV